MLDSMYTVKTDLNKEKWLLVLHHNYSSAGFFTIDQCLKSSEKTRYSIMGELEKLLKKSHKYEFFLEFPDNKYLRWTQKFLPTEKKSSDRIDAGVNIVSSSNTFYYFRGLLRTPPEYSNTCFDGQSGVSYWYSVGTINYCCKIPGAVKKKPNGENDYISMDYLSLWALIKKETKW